MRARHSGKAYVLIAMLVGAATMLRGQQPPQVSTQNPLATEKHRRLAFLAGQWEEDVSYTAAGPGEDKGSGSWLARPMFGLYLHIRYEGTGREGPYRAFGVLAYDREQNRYRMWWFDAAAGIGEYSGDFTDANTLVLEHAGTVEGKALRERIRYTRVSANEVRTTIEQAWGDGELKPYLEAVAHRVAGSGPRRSPPRPPQL